MQKRSEIKQIQKFTKQTHWMCIRPLVLKGLILQNNINKSHYPSTLYLSVSSHVHTNTTIEYYSHWSSIILWVFETKTSQIKVEFLNDMTAILDSNNYIIIIEGHMNIIQAQQISINKAQLLLILSTPALYTFNEFVDKFLHLF